MSAEKNDEPNAESLLAAYLASSERGEDRTLEDLCARHPGRDDELRRAWEDHQRGLRALEGADSGATEPLSASDGTGALPRRLRYVGDYELLEEIARGGMGIVYRARQVSLDREVAVKMILAGQLADEELVARFRAEAEAAADLQHPGIVSVHEVGEFEGQQYFSMDLVEGVGLDELVREGPLRARRAAEYVHQIAEAIQYAHERGVLHRDLKPSNVLIDRSDRPRVTDFGLSKRLDDEAGRTVTGAVMGTPSYMAPEQAAGRREAIGTVSDVYALGAVLYELVTGRPPFRAESVLETLRQVQDSRPASPRDLNRSVPTALESVILKCLEKQPEARYQSAGALAEDLRRFLQRKPVEARPASRLRSVKSWAREHPWVITATVCVFLLGALGLTYWMWAEQAYWRRVAADPSFVRREESPWSERLMLLGAVEVLLLAAIAFLRSRHFEGRGRSTWSFRVGLFLSAACIGVGGFGFVSAIDALVWERQLPLQEFVVCTVVVLSGAVMGYHVLHAQDRYEAGHAATLSGEQSAALEDLLCDGPASKFRERYRRALRQYRDWTGASAFASRVALDRIRRRLRFQRAEGVPRHGPIWVMAATVLPVVLVPKLVTMAMKSDYFTRLPEEVDLVRFAETFDPGRDEYPDWRAWGVVTDWLIEEGEASIDLARPVSAVLSSSMSQQPLSSHALLEILRHQLLDDESLRKLATSRESDLDQLLEKNWALRTTSERTCAEVHLLLATREVSTEDRERMRNRGWASRPIELQSGALDDAWIWVRTADALGVPISDRKAEVWAILEACWSGSKISSSRAAFTDDPEDDGDVRFDHRDVRATVKAIDLMHRFGVPDGIDTERLANFLDRAARTQGRSGTKFDGHELIAAVGLRKLREYGLVDE